MTASVRVPAGHIEYGDTGGGGPVLLFTHGLIMSGTAWRNVTPALAGRYRCVTPTLPLGGHRVAMDRDADLSLGGLARIVADFMAALDLTSVTLIQNDWGPAQPLLGLGLGERVIRLVITSSEVWANFTPTPALPLVWASRIPGGLVPLLWALQHRFVQRAPGSWGWLSKREVPAEIMQAWMSASWRDREVRRDLGKYLSSRTSPDDLAGWADKLAAFEGPVLVVWAEEDKLMPPAHAHELGRRLSDCRVVMVKDSYTLLAEDQPEAVSVAIAAFLKETHP